MKTYPLLAAGALALLSFDLPAYQIVESYFHVEVAPNKYATSWFCAARTATRSSSPGSRSWPNPAGRT